MKVLIVEPGEYPREEVIEPGLDALQKAVGGYIEVTYPWEEQAALICNDEGKLLGLPLNRALYGEGGEMYDIIAGTFIVVGLTEEDFGDLSPDLMEHFKELFGAPEMFVRVGKEIQALKAG